MAAMKEMYPKNGRVVLHVDMNSFYASVEMAYDSSLKGKPLAVAGNVEERRGIIVTCSYEARKFGVKTTMPLWEAKKLCPHLIVKKPNFPRYHEASLKMFDILRTYSDLVEPVSIDEGYIDITDSHRIGSPIQIAQSIQKQILQQLKLPCSIGVAPNKFLAKMASDMKKPLGITILRKRHIPAILWPMDVIEMHGVGEKTAEKLATLGIHTIGDLAKGNDLQLKTLLGINGLKLKERANGIDMRSVDPDSVYDFKSVGNSTTLPKDISNQQMLFQVLDGLVEKVAERLYRKKVVAQTLTITIRYKDRKTITRSKKLSNPVKSIEEISGVAKQLFLKHWNGESVRLLGVTGTDLLVEGDAVRQLDLFSFEKEARKEPLYQALEELQKKYGAKIIFKAGEKGSEQNSHSSSTSNTSFNKDFLQVQPIRTNIQKEEKDLP